MEKENSIENSMQLCQKLCLEVIENKNEWQKSY